MGVGEANLPSLLSSVSFNVILYTVGVMPTSRCNQKNDMSWHFQSPLKNRYHGHSQMVASDVIILGLFHMESVQMWGYCPGCSQIPLYYLAVI